MWLIVWAPSSQPAASSRRTSGRVKPPRERKEDSVRFSTPGQRQRRSSGNTVL